MKNGERLLCKKNYNILDECYFYKNKSYYIKYMGSDGGITMEYDMGSVVMFTFEKNGYNYIFDYFYSPEEIRLLKINSL
ncbi:hypothetical protein M0Q50_02485 [bacterium]|jgi:hypothetical protein|nr:hypothetical protein [bacterium]